MKCVHASGPHAQITGAGGKRKLDFSSSRAAQTQPLRGKVFFLDLPLESQKSLEDIEKEIVKLGGAVEKFFDKKVGYLITTRHKVKPQAQAAAKTCSPLTPSPGTPDSVRSPFSHSPAVEEGQGQWSAKPNQASGAKPKGPVLRRTRQGIILDASKSLQKGKKATKMIEFAREWGTKMLTPAELWAELKRFTPPRPLCPEAGEKSEKRRKTPSVRELKPPFMKVEDHSGLYRPLLYETEAWPRPDPDCPPGACPYDPHHRRTGKVVPQPSRATGARLTQDLAASLPGPAPVAAATGPAPVATGTAAKKKPGYCECCAIRYDDLKMHLQSKKHREYATNSENFASLDQFVAEKRLDHKSFLESLREKCAFPEKCVVDLVSLPPTPHPPRPHNDVNDARGSGSPAPPPSSPCPSKACSETASPAGHCGHTLAERCNITAGFSSPKRGALCLTPVKILGGKRLLSGEDLAPQSTKRQKSLPSDIVPETPEKHAEQSTAMLCDIRRMVQRKLSLGGEGCVSSTEDPRKGRGQSPGGRKGCVVSSASGRNGCGQAGEKVKGRVLPSKKRQGRGRPLGKEIERRVTPPGEEGKGRVLPLFEPEEEKESVLQDAASPVKKRGRQQKRVQVNKELLDEVTRDSPYDSSLTLSPGTSPSITRKSPRLLGKPRPAALPTPTRPVPLVQSVSVKDVQAKPTS